MSILQYSVRAECCACGQLDTVRIQLPDFYDDEDVQDALEDEGAANCRKCGSFYWTPAAHPEKWIADHTSGGNCSCHSQLGVRA